MKRVIFLRIQMACLFLLAYIASSLSTIYADTLILKNGRQIRAHRIWEEGDLIKYSLYGSVVGHPKTDVLRIVPEGLSEASHGQVEDFFYPWNLGQNIDAVVALCERYDFPLHREGLISANKRFNPKMCMPYINSHSKFNYKGTKSGYPSVVSFAFDPATKRLTTVEIRIRKPNSVKSDDFVDSIGHILSRNYGSPDTNARKKIWLSGKNSIVLSNGNSAAVVNLADYPLVQKTKPSPASADAAANDVLRPANASRRSIFQPIKPASRNLGDQSGKLFNTLLWVMIGPLIALFVVLAIIAFLKVIVKKKSLSFVAKGAKTEIRFDRSPKGFFFGNVNTADGAFSYEKVNGLFTNAEKAFLSVLQDIVGDDYLIQGKVRLADLISPNSSLNRTQSMWSFRKISQKHVDFVICDKQDFNIMGVVELDDRSHLRPDRIARDKFVDAALAEAGIPILHYPVRAKYSLAEIQAKLCETIGLKLERQDNDPHFEDNRWRPRSL